MASLIDGEPAPRTSVAAHRQIIPAASFIELPRIIDRPTADFFDVLDGRRSSTGETLQVEHLSSLLWHSVRLKERRPGRFGIDWESRSAPSAGGLHPIRLLVLSVDGPDKGIYDDHRHALSPIDCGALELNRASIGEILGVCTGTTIQFAADARLVEACYENCPSLIWRDAGALTATMCLVAAALGLAATPIGRTGDAIVRAALLSESFIGAGAVHLGTRSTAQAAETLAKAATGEFT